MRKAFANEAVIHCKSSVFNDIFFVGAWFIHAREPARILLRAGINLAPTSDAGLSLNRRITAHKIFFPGTYGIEY
jgi:hypothetical protein